MQKTLYRLKLKLAGLLLRSGGRLIDLEWHRQHNLPPSPAWRKLSLLHALLFKSHEKNSTHPLFDIPHFTQKCLAQGLPPTATPLKTYLSDSRYWGIDPHPLFETEFYTAQVTEPFQQAPLLHYLNQGHLKHDPHPLFQRSWYLISYPALENLLSHCALVHYVKIGYKSLASTHPLFHAEFYASQAGLKINNKLAAEDSLRHFIESSEPDTSCHPLFSPKYFRQQIARGFTTSSYATLVKHYLFKRSHWKINPHILFDSRYYTSQTSGLSTGKAPLVEYIETNFRARDPHILFHTAWYRSRVKYIEKFSGQGAVPLIHFIVAGYANGTSPHPLFSLSLYREKYLPEEDSCTNPLEDFLISGEKNQPHPLFQTGYFIEQCKLSGLEVPTHPLRSYLSDKKYWPVNTHPLFDSNYYLSQLDVPSTEAPLVHFLNGGHLQNDPHPLFQRTWYLLQFPQLENLPHHCAILHYLASGYQSATSTHPLFHAVYYAEQAGIDSPNGTVSEDPLLHFVTSASRSASFHPLFSLDYFSQQLHLDSTDSAYNILVNHYILKPENWVKNPHILFNSQHYLSQNSGKNTGRSPLAEYIEFNHLFRDPHPLFHTDWYLSRVGYIRDLKGQAAVPLVHYVMASYLKAGSPHPVFAAQWYKNHYLTDLPDDINPLMSYLQSDMKNQPHPLFLPEYFRVQCRRHDLAYPDQPLLTYISDKNYWLIDPHPLFSASYYISQLNSPVIEAPLSDFLNNGHSRHDPHPLFRRQWYMSSFPELSNLPRLCAVLHYLKTGFRFGTSTHPLFLGTYYAEQAGLEKDNGEYIDDPLLHFIQSPATDTSCHPLFSPKYFREQTEGLPLSYKSAAQTLIDDYLLNKNNWHHNPHRLFDAVYYQEQLLTPTSDSPLSDYISVNAHRLNPHPMFNTEWYLGREKFLESFKGNSSCPLLHFVTDGYKRGESPHPLFSLQWYRHTYMNSKRDNTNPLEFFLESGEATGTRPNALFPENWKEFLSEKHQENTLSSFAKKLKYTFPEKRNRISDAFLTKPLVSRESENHVNDIDQESIRSYIILFTPRSGSTWLTELLSRTGAIGKPTEWFNPDLILPAIRNLPQHPEDIHEYCSMLKLHESTSDGIFGTEISSAQLSLLEELVDIEETFNKPNYILHLRANIVAQAVSLFLATESGFFHASNVENSANHTDYNPIKIEKWLMAILKEEQNFCRFLNKLSLPYYTSWYEDLQGAPEQSVSRIQEYILGRCQPHVPTNNTRNSRISSDVNRTYENRFRQEFPDIVQEIESSRPFVYSPVVQGSN